MKREENRGDIVIFKAEDGQTALEVTLEDETVWLSLNQMAALFLRDKSVISRHLRNVFKEKEISRDSTAAKFAAVHIDGNKRIAAALFLWFLERNRILYRVDGTKRIAENALVAMTLLIAESRPTEKDIITRVVANLLNKKNS